MSETVRLSSVRAVSPCRRMAGPERSTTSAVTVAAAYARKEISSTSPTGRGTTAPSKYLFVGSGPATTSIVCSPAPVMLVSRMLQRYVPLPRSSAHGNSRVSRSTVM